MNWCARTRCSTRPFWATWIVSISALAFAVGAFVCTDPPPAAAATGPWFSVSPLQPAEQVWGNDWQPNGSVTITVEDPGTPATPDFSTTAPTDEAGHFQADNLAFDIQSGDLVTVDDGVTAEQHTVLPLSVTGFDTAADAVWGWGEPGLMVRAHFWDDTSGTMIYRDVIADAGGYWIADFGTAVGVDPWQAAYDITPVSPPVYVWQADANGNQTQVDASIPNPQFGASPERDQMNGWNGWQPSALIVIGVDDPGTPENPDANTGTLADEQGNWTADFSAIIDLAPGQIVTVGDGTHSKTLTISGFAVTGTDAVADTVSGVGTPGSWATVGVNGNPGGMRGTEVDEFGNWTVDFSVASGPNPMDQPVDLGPGSNGMGWEQDADWDQTQADWRILDPRFEADARSDSIMGWDWPGNAGLLVVADDPGTPQNPDYSESITADWSGAFNLDVRTLLDIREGISITVTDGEIAKQHVVTSLQVTAVDQDAETVAGVAAPGSHVRVWANLPNGPSREVDANGSGDWIADFSVVGGGGTMPQDQVADLGPGTNGCAAQTDADHDETWYSWFVRTPSFGVVFDHEEIFGGQWTPDSLIAVDIDDPGTPENPDYAFGSISDQDGNFGTGFEGAFDLQPGHIVTVSDGTDTKVHTVVPLSVTEVYPPGDTVAGTAPAGTWVQVQVWGGVSRSVQANEAGEWVANFSVAVGPEPWDQAYDIMPGENGEAVVNDADNDSTHARWHASNPMFGVDPDNEEIWGGDWAPGGSIAYTIDDPGTPENPDYSDSTGADAWGNFGFDLQGIYDIQPGFDVRVSDTSASKQTYVQAMTIESIDPDADTVSGTAPPTCYVQVTLQAENGPQRWVLSDGLGQWTADFSVATGSEPWEQPCDIQPGQNGEAWITDDDGDATRAMFHLAAPQFSVDPAREDLWGWDWQPNSTISVTVDDPGTPGSPDFEDSLATGDWGDWGTGYMDIYDFKTGDEVTISDGVTTKTHTVTSLEVTGADADQDVVFGTAEPWSSLEVSVWNDEGSYRNVQADEFGDWVADFSVAAGEDPGSQPADLWPGADGQARQYDEDGDATSPNWHIANPSFGVQATSDDVWGWDWQPGTLVDVTVEDPGTPESPDYITQMEVDPWTNFGSWIEFDLAAGQTVTITDGTLTKSTVVTALAITSVDPASDSVAGTAEPLSWVDVQVWDDWGTYRHVQADVNGDWLADFSIATGEGDQEQPADITRGTEGAANQWDDDNDTTQESWRVPNPAFNIKPASQDLWGNDWPEGIPLAITIDDPGTPANPDYLGESVADEWGEFNTWVGFAVAPGDFITVTDGSITKEHTVTSLTITGVDADTDQVFGTAEADTWLSVWIDDADVWRQVQADGNGDWSSDFSAEWDIGPGNSISAAQADEDDDQTFAQWYIPNPRIVAQPAWDAVEGWEWAPSSEVTVTIDDPATAPEPDLTTTVLTDEGGNFWFEAASADFAVDAGFVITVTDGQTAKDHVVTQLDVTQVDPALDLVLGVAEPFSFVRVYTWVEFGESERWVQADDLGNWVADFSVDGGGMWQPAVDLGPGSSGNAEQYDADNDVTARDWRVPDPGFGVNPQTDDVWGFEWEPFAFVSITIDDPGTPDPADYFANVVQTNEWGEWSASLAKQGIDVEAGFTLTVSDGTTIKQHTVYPLHITEVDTVADTVSGMTGAGDWLWVNVDTGGDDVGRWVQADAGGAWTADFSVPAPDMAGQTYDIVADTTGYANQDDEDGDHTQLQWRILRPRLIVKPEADAISGEDWSGLTDLTIRLERAGTPKTPDATATVTTDEWGTFDLPDLGFDILPGDVVTAENGTAKTHTVTALAVLGTDYQADTVFGTATPFSEVWVPIMSSEGQQYWRLVTANASGDWIADFSVPAGESPYEVVYDIALGDSGWAEQTDADFDATRVDYWVTFAPPLAVDDTGTVAEDTTLTVAAPGVLGNDENSDGALVLLDLGPAHGSLNLNATTGAYTYRPAANWNGTDSFSYVLEKGEYTSEPASVTITVTAVNDAPVAVNDSYSTAEDTALNVVAASGVGSNDTDVDSASRTYQKLTDPAHGTVALNANGSFTYTPAANWNGTDSFTYRAHDGALYSNAATVTITVSAVNDAPVAVSDAYTISENATLTVGAAAGVGHNDSDIDNATLTFEKLTDPVNHGTLSFSADGSFVYRAIPGSGGTDMFTYRAYDGEAYSAPATVAITITEMNSPPIAFADTYETAEDTPLYVDAAVGVGANDTDPDGNPLTFVDATDPAHGTLSFSEVDGSFAYTPAEDWNGTDSFTYRAFDGAAPSAAQTVTITVTAVNDTPVAASDAWSTAQDHPLTVAAPGVLSNDSDVDGDSLTAMLGATVGHGTLSLNSNGGFTYTPTAGWFGTDTFTYQARDALAASNVVTVTITVTEVPPLPPVVPVAGNDRYTTAIEGSKLAYPDGLDPAGERTVVIATGRNWPDALGGTSLAGALDGPVLLTDTNALPDAVAAEIDRLGADKAIILGGTGAVGAAVETRLRADLGAADVERIAGANRYETADLIATRVVAILGTSWDGTGIVATGNNYPDALAVSPLAAARYWPLFLAHPTTGLSNATKAIMVDAEHVVVLGGTGAVSQAVENYLNTTFGDANVERLAGADRYATAVAVAEYGVAHAGLGWNGVAIATGENFPDALSGGVVQGKRGSVMILTRSQVLSPATHDALVLHRTEIDSVTYFGGTGAVSQAVRDAVTLALQ